MRYAIEGEQKQRFWQEGRIEFEAAVSKEHAEQAFIAATAAAPAACGTRDLWRRAGSAVRRLVLQRRLSEVAGELFGARELRVAFDQLLHPSERLQYAGRSLEALASVQGIVGCCIIRLAADAQGDALLSQRGSALFLSKSCPIDSIAEGVYLLIAYCRSVSLYVANSQDPYNHFLKGLALGFGDRLSNKTHPLVLSP